MTERSLRVARMALFAALTLVLCYVESGIVLPVSIPGVKLGLANVAVLVALYLMGPRWALGIMALKIVVISFFVGAPSMMLYSLAGSALAFGGMLAAWKLNLFGIVATSVLSAVLHNVGQLLMAMALMQTTAILINLPVMMVAACIMGTLTGSVAAGTVKALPAVKLSGAAKQAKAPTRDKDQLTSPPGAGLSEARSSR